MMMSYMDTRWSKLKNYDFDDPEEHRAELRKFINTDNDSDDEEWLQQLQKDYSKRGKHTPPLYSRFSILERYLILSLGIVGLITFALFISLIVSHSRSEVTFKDHPHHSDASPSNQNPPKNICLRHECIKASGHILQYVSDSVDPCVNFYEYSCKNWLASSSIPLGLSKWTSFHDVAERNKHVLKRILDRLTLSTDKHDVFTKIKRHYDACNNRNLVEIQGRTPIENLIQFVGSWSVTNTSQWNDEEWNFGQVLNRIHHLKSMPLFYMYVGPDDKNSSRNIIQIEQSGITLPSEEYYLKNKSDKFITSYINLIIQVGHLLNGDEKSVRDQALEIFEFEKKIAEIFEPKEKLRQTRKIYHQMTVEELQTLCPAIPWLDYLNSMFSSKVPFDEQVVVYTPVYLKKMSDLVIRTERRILANYMVWHLIKPMLVLLAKPFRDAALKFMKDESGAQSGEFTWKTCVIQTDSVLGFATGNLFVRENEVDGITVKDEAETLLRYLRESLVSRIREADWMDNITKEKAIDKANAMTDKIGYPEWIRNVTRLQEFYKNLTVTNDPFQNYLNAREFYHERGMHRRGKKPDQTEWHMTPTEVNAYYNSPSNYVAFPLGILQPPFFSAHLPMSINFGAVGSVMGHEITHGFDSQGRHFDKNGNMRNWWSQNSTNMFEQKAKCMERQYANYTVNDLKVDGQQTLAENIADNGGLHITFKAYQRWVEDHGPEPALPGINMTHEQLVFFGFAQVWCSLSTKKMLDEAILVDSHSPEEIRVKAAVRNSLEFGVSFKCPVGSPMNPEDKCVVW